MRLAYRKSCNPNTSPTTKGFNADGVERSGWSTVGFADFKGLAEIAQCSAKSVESENVPR